MRLRQYQQDAIESVDKAFQEYDRVLGVAATGAGKTIIFSAIAARNQGKTLVLAHRDELLSQAQAKLTLSTGIESELERADARASLDARVVVASIQTLCRRFERFPANHFTRIIVDEAHHALANSYQPTLQYFLGGGAKVLGVTATPGTRGKKALGNFFETIAFEVGLIELIRAGYLSPISVKSFPLIGGGAEPISFAVKNGDYDQEQVDHALDPYLESVVARLGAEIGDRKTLVFLPLIKTVERFVALCNAAGIKAAGVSGVSEERANILSAHGTDFQILANSMLLTEGYDDPAISAMMILRPTRSEILFSQMVGRGTRIHCPWGCTERCTHGSRKRNLLLLDPLWLHEDMNLVRPANLVSGRDEDRRSMSERVAAKQEELDLLNMLADAEHEREKSLAEKLARMEKRKTKTISVEEWAVLSHAPNIADFEPTMKWHESPISPKQAEMLVRFGFDAGSVRGRGHASALLDVFFSRRKQGLATVAQVRLMTRMKHPNPDTETFAGAKAWLDQRFSKTTK